MASNAIDMELENIVFLIAPVQFSVVRIILLFINSQIQYKILHILSCTCFFSNDFAEFCKILLIACSCKIFGQFHKIAKFQKACSELALFDMSQYQAC